MMKTKQKIINQFKPATIFEYQGKLYFCSNNENENLYNEEGNIVGKAYMPEVAKIIANADIIYENKPFDDEPLIEED